MLHKILVMSPVSKEQQDRILAALAGREVIFETDKQKAALLLPEVDACLGNPLINCLAGAKHLQWLMLQSAGTDGYCKAGVLPADTVLSCATGAYGTAVAEHAFAATVALLKKLPTYAMNQAQKVWHAEGNIQSLFRKTVLIVGYGDIGRHYAALIRPFASEILAITRHRTSGQDADAKYYALDALDELLPRADIVMMALPGLADTFHVLDRDRIAKMKTNAVVLNVGRGSAIDTEALTDALKDRRIAGAGLDVFETEPLPSDHPLWQLPNVLITPHIAGGFWHPDTLDDIVSLFLDNLKRFEAGQELISRVDLSTGYAKHP